MVYPLFRHEATKHQAGNAYVHLAFNVPGNHLPDLQ